MKLSSDILAVPENLTPGSVVEFIGYNPQEMESDSFAPGDVMVVVAPSGMYDGVNVRSWFTGTLDMVWPEEILAL